jgi:hypothetical protein
MTEDDLYNFSKNFDLLTRKIKASMYFHYYRYSKFVDNSPMGDGGYPDGLRCSYAKRTKTLGKEEEEKLKEFLNELISDAQNLIHEMEGKRNVRQS